MNIIRYLNSSAVAMTGRIHGENTFKWRYDNTNITLKPIYFQTILKGFLRHSAVHRHNMSRNK
jgi:hypothetical protein